jgi:hypothetical protein
MIRITAGGKAGTTGCPFRIGRRGKRIRRRRDRTGRLGTGRLGTGGLGTRRLGTGRLETIGIYPQRRFLIGISGTSAKEIDSTIGIHREGPAFELNKCMSPPVLSWESKGNRRCGEGKDGEIHVRAHVRNICYG